MFFARDKRQAAPQVAHAAVEFLEREGLTERCKYTIREIGLESHLVQLHEKAGFLVCRIRHNLWRVDKSRYVLCGDLATWTEHTRAELDRRDMAFPGSAQAHDETQCTRFETRHDRRIEERRRFERVFPAEKRANQEPARWRQRPVGKDMYLDPPVNA